MANWCQRHIGKDGNAGSLHGPVHGSHGSLGMDHFVRLWSDPTFEDRESNRPLLIPTHHHTQVFLSSYIKQHNKQAHNILFKGLHGHTWFQNWTTRQSSIQMFQSWTRDQHDHQFATQENRFIVLLRRRMSVHQESTTPRKLPGKISQSSHYTARDVAQRRQPCIVERKWGRKQLWRCPLLLQFHIRRQCVRCGRLFEITGVVQSDYCSQQRRRVGIWLEEEEEGLLECTCTTITDRLAGPNQFTWWCLTLDAWCLTRVWSCMKRVPCNGYSEDFKQTVV